MSRTLAVPAGLLAAASTAAAIWSLALRRADDLIALLGSPLRDAPPAARRLLSALGSAALVRRLVPAGAVRARLRAARSPWSIDEIVGAKVGVVVMCSGLAVSLPGSLSLLAIPIGLIGVRLPDWLISRSARRRLSDAERELPLLLDLLALATSAGLPPQLAIRRAMDPIDGPLADELRVALRATDLGGRWRDELARVVGRLPLTDLRRTVSTLTRTEALGTSLADEVARLAADVRETHRALTAERARTAPVKMLFPLVFLILPAFLLLTVVPVLITTVRSIG